ncbi:MAG: sulfur carrier protein ThiS [Acidobacteria bacterium]|nr:MAG: sulfur carrier protein ThiS [Acidobacteriota bacterium]
MRILVNGEERELDEPITLLEFLLRLGIPKERVAIEVNKEVVRRKDWGITIINDGDRIEIVHFVGGG